MRAPDGLLGASTDPMRVCRSAWRSLLDWQARSREHHRARWTRLEFLGHLLQVVVFGLIPVVLTAFQLNLLIRGHDLAVDYSSGPWVAGHRMLAGLTPYVGTNSPQLQGIAFVYPAVAALLLAPFSLLPHGTANLVFTFVDIGALLAALRVLDVKDWRVYGVALMWPAVLAAWETANITLLLALGLAFAWRYRDRALAAGVLVALLISVKVFLWPLALWLAATRRYRALAYAGLAGLVFNVVAWGVVGFDQISRYDGLLATLTRYQDDRGYSLVALVVRSGSDRHLAYGVLFAVTVALCGACLAAGRRFEGRLAFALSIAASLAATPISWLHYFALLVVPMAIARPRLSPLWLAPLLLIFPTVGPSGLQTTVMYGLAAVTCAATVTPGMRHPRHAGLPTTTTT